MPGVIYSVITFLLVQEVGGRRQEAGGRRKTLLHLQFTLNSWRGGEFGVGRIERARGREGKRERGGGR